MLRRRPRRTSMPASRPPRFSPIPAMHATAVRGKSRRPMRDSCGNIIPPARGKRPPWRLILPRSALIRGRFSSGGHPCWARGRQPPQGPIRPNLRTPRRGSRATAVGRPSRANRPQVQTWRAWSGLVVPRRVWKPATSRLLARREAVPRPLRRKPPPRPRRGSLRSKTSRSSAEPVAFPENRIPGF
jgi:hypothetical protein